MSTEDGCQAIFCQQIAPISDSGSPLVRRIRSLEFFAIVAAFIVKDICHTPMTETSVVGLTVKRLFLFSLSLNLPLFFASAAGRAAESRPTWQVEWEKALKAAEAEGEVTVYVVDYPSLTVTHFQKAYPKSRLNQVDPRLVICTASRRPT
jgi:hypothetical protein